MRKMVLKTAISTHLILDLQDVAKFISKLHKSRVSSHNAITSSTARLLSNKMFKKKKLW